MEIKSFWKESLVLAKNENLTAFKNLREKVEGDRTLININTFAKDYKLKNAYVNVRNLEVRQEGPLVEQRFRDYIEGIGGIRQVNFQEVPRPDFTSDESYLNHYTRRHYGKGKMLVIVHDDIFENTLNAVNQYVIDVAYDGYYATVHRYLGGTPADVRNYIRSKGVAGVLMVGAIPAAWYEMDNDFHNNHSEFPCDLFYMDTNGSWTDTDSDGLYNTHNGDLDPEIWVGRLYTPTASGNDADLINNYFGRNHQFRTGQLGHANTALAYVDDDWQGFDDCAMDEMFPAAQITKYTNPVTTDADLYKAEVNSLRSWVQLCAHSSVHSHALRVGATNEHINTSYFRDTNPPNAHFYNLFCCGPGKFTTDDYLAGWYIFDKAGGGNSNGLTAIASAKTGSMLYFEDFYEPLGHGKTIGEALVSWWQDRGATHELSEIQWFYGLTILGDPTLTWWKGAVPVLEQPDNEDVFDHWPRKMQLRWDPVNLPNARYTVEVDAFGAINAGQWAEQSGQIFYRQHNVVTNTLDHTFVGAQRGRWRVRATVDGRVCSWSPWSYFRFTV